MKKSLLIFAVLFLLKSATNAQPFVQIPDANFAAFLTTNYAACMSGNTLNTTCPAVLSATSMNVSGLSISNVTGVQYFTNLNNLNCSNNSISSLPYLSAPLATISCNNNSLTTITNIPFWCSYFNCQNNLLSTLPAIPTTCLGISLYCGNNNIGCFPIFPSNSTTLNLLPNPFVCLPNYVPGAMNGTLLATPICSVGNIFNCAGVNAISGNFYNDLNANCTREISDLNVNYVPARLYNSSGSLIAQYYASNSSAYSFNASAGTYSVVVDTSNTSLMPQCPTPGMDSTNLVLSIGTPSINNVNFNFVCQPGVDVGCTSHVLAGQVFPGQNHQMWLNVGNYVNYGNLLCGVAGTGQVIVSISGPVTINGPIAGSYTPSIAGNTCTYSIPSFSNLTWYNDLRLSIGTLTSATIGQSVCVSVTVNPSVGDNNLSNNTYTFCHPVGNSYDPNEKQTTPENVLPGYQDWFNYTVDFQNLGNAAAFNIRILDTLDNNLDLRTLQVVGNSDPFNVSVNGNVANFFFPNIMLPPSISDPAGSKGFIQYRVKPKAALPNGTQIKNRAHIYFDFNPAVITNQTINNFVLPSGLTEVNKTSLLNLYPNPVKSQLNFQFASDTEKIISIYDIVGKEVLNQTAEGKSIQITIENIQNGIYFLKISEENSSSVHKIIIEK